MHKTYLTPGPSELYFTVEFHIKQALKARIPTISHRSKTFEGIYEGVKNNLRQLLNLPDDYQVYFASSATEIWERMAQNLIEKESFHLTSGAFAEKFIKVVEAQNKTAITYRVSDGKPFLIDSISIPESTELISITQNETSTGTRFPVEDISAIRKSFPDPLIAIDAVSSLPYENFDFSKIDSLYFSVQKCFGLPSGLGVWFGLCFHCVCLAPSCPYVDVCQRSRAGKGQRSVLETEGWFCRPPSC